MRWVKRKREPLNKKAKKNETRQENANGEGRRGRDFNATRPFYHRHRRHCRRRTPHRGPDRGPFPTQPPPWPSHTAPPSHSDPASDWPASRTPRSTTLLAPLSLNVFHPPPSLPLPLPLLLLHPYLRQAGPVDLFPFPFSFLPLPRCS